MDKKRKINLNEEPTDREDLLDTIISMQKEQSQLDKAKKSRDEYASKIKGHYYGNWNGLFAMYRHGHNDIDWLNRHIDAAMEYYAASQSLADQIAAKIDASDVLRDYMSYKTKCQTFAEFLKENNYEIIKNPTTK